MDCGLFLQVEKVYVIVCGNLYRLGFCCFNVIFENLISVLFWFDWLPDMLADYCK